MLLQRGNCKGKPLFFIVFREELNSMQFWRIQLNPVGLATRCYMGLDFISDQTRSNHSSVQRSQPTFDVYSTEAESFLYGLHALPCGPLSG